MGHKHNLVIVSQYRNKANIARIAVSLGKNYESLFHNCFSFAPLYLSGLC